MKRLLLYHWPIVTLLLVTLGCDKADMMQKFAPPEDQAQTTHYIDLLRQRRLDEVQKAMDPAIRDDLKGETLELMAASFPKGQVRSVQLVGAWTVNDPNSSTVNLTYEYHIEGQWLLTNVALKRQGGATTIVGFNVYPQPASLAEQNRFTLSGRSLVHYGVLALVVIFPLLTLYAIIVCARTTLRGRKWPWIVFILVGIGGFALNWTTGEWVVKPVFFQLFSASGFAPPYGPWTLTISIPLGAIVFLMRREKLRAVPAGS